MPARDEPDTVPPPAGEDDAYSAATRVGAMPAEVLAQLREEAFLAEENEKQARAAAAAAAVPKAAPLPSDLVGTAANGEGTALASPPAAEVPNGAAAGVSDAAPSAPPAASLAPTPAAAANVPSSLPLAKNDAQTVATSKNGARWVLVGLVIAIVAFAFVMALLSRRG